MEKKKVFFNKLINKINSKKTTLGSVLTEQHLNSFRFLTLLDIDEELISQINMQNFNELLASKDTKIYLDPNDSSNDWLEIYSPSLGLSFTFNKESIKEIKTARQEDDVFVYEDYTYKILFNNDSGVDLIEFELSSSADISKSKNHILTDNYALENLCIDVCAIVNGKTEQFKCAIFNEFLVKDLKYVISMLTSGNVSDAYTYLLTYPAEQKIITNNSCMHNLTNR